MFPGLYPNPAAFTVNDPANPGAVVTNAFTYAGTLQVFTSGFTTDPSPSTTITYDGTDPTNLYAENPPNDPVGAFTQPVTPG